MDFATKLRSDIDSLDEKFHEEDTIIITFVDYKYLPIFDIFYKHFSQLNLNNLIVISLDEDTYRELTTRNIRTILIEYNIVTRDIFWKFRLDVINIVFKHCKKDILHCDSDCFWFKNILEEIKRYDDYAIIGHIAFGGPKEFVKEYGFVLCCGFYRIKYNEININIIDTIQQEIAEENDDQVLFNNYIFHHMDTIEDVKDKIMVKKITVNGWKVGIIRNDIICRKFKKNLYCFHPFLSMLKEIPDKIEEIKKYMEV